MYSISCNKKCQHGHYHCHHCLYCSGGLSFMGFYTSVWSASCMNAVKLWGDLFFFVLFHFKNCRLDLYICITNPLDQSDPQIERLHYELLCSHFFPYIIHYLCGHTIHAMQKCTLHQPDTQPGYLLHIGFNSQLPF